MPSEVKNPEVSACIHATNTGEELHIGKVVIPINKAITFQGGSIEDPYTGQEKFVGAYNGETLSKTPLSVPGGLAVVNHTGFPKGLQEFYEKLINEGLTGVTATIELAGSPTINLPNLLQEQDVALGLPIRIKLSDIFLGEESTSARNLTR